MLNLLKDDEVLQDLNRLERLLWSDLDGERHNLLQLERLNAHGRAVNKLLDTLLLEVAQTYVVHQILNLLFMNVRDRPELERVDVRPVRQSVYLLLRQHVC